MNRSFDIIFFSSSDLNSGIEEVLQELPSPFSYSRVESTDEFHKKTAHDLPGLILADFVLVSKIPEEVKKKTPLVLLVQPEQEGLAIKEEVFDYIFYDRPGRLVLVLKNMLNNASFQREKEYDEVFRAFYENSMDGILLTIPDGQVLAANPAACKIFGMTEEEICNAGRFGLVDQTDQRFAEAVAERSRNGKVKAVFNFIRKDGSRFPAEITSSIYHNMNGEIRTSIIFRDISDRQKIEERLQISNHNNRLLFQYNPLPNWIYDRQSLEIVDVNLAAIAHYGYSREEFIGLNIKNLRSPEDVPKLMDCLNHRRDQQGFTGFEVFDHLKKNGEKVRMETFGYHIRYNNRNCTLVSCLDITEKEETLRQLKENSNKLQVAQKIARLGYWQNNLEKEELFWSDEVYSIWGREKENFKPSLQAFRESIHPEDLQKFQFEMNLAMNEQKDLDYEHRIILPDGKVKWVHEQGKITRNSNGEIIFGGTVQDITDRKSFNEKLVLSETRNKAILQSQTNYLIRIDLEGNYSYCNEKFLIDFGWIYPDQNLVGQRAESSVKEYHHVLVKEIFKKCLAKPNHTVQAEIDKLTRNGEAKTTLWDFICLTNAQGEPLEIQAVGIDITDRVEAEKALRESNQRYELVSEASSDAIYDWDVESGKITWNHTYSELFGYSKEFLDTTIEVWESHIHPEDMEVLEDLEKALLSSGTRWQAEYRYRKADGTYAYVSERGAIIRNAEGKAVRMVGAIQDVTESRLALQKLMRSEARHRGLIQSQTNYVLRTDFRGNHTYCNEKFVEEFGWIYGKRDLIGLNALISIKDYHHQRIEEMVERCWQNPGKVFQIELDKPGKNGKTKTTLWDIVYLEAGTPEDGEIQCIGIDITDRVKAERQMKFQAALLNKIGQAVIAHEVNGKIRYWNNAASEIYGWDREEALGKDVKKLISEFADVREKEVIETLQKGVPVSAEYQVTGKNGNVFPALVMDSPFTDEKGILKGVISISSDISERKKNELELKNYTMELIAANKGLEQFSFIVSHNLRAPLANLLGITNLLEEDDLDMTIKERLMQELLNNIKRLDEVVNDLNAILRVKTELNENRERIDLFELVNSIKWSIDHLIQKEEVEIITDFAEQPEFTTVKSYLHSIFYNLILNSIKYRQPDKKPKIKISSRLEKDYLELIFEDNGLGIDLAKKADQLFGLYKRFHHHVEGKGMGLFMVKTQVESLGGKIDVESEQNKGSKFILEFKIENEQSNRKDERITQLFTH